MTVAAARKCRRERDFDCFMIVDVLFLGGLDENSAVRSRCQVIPITCPSSDSFGTKHDFSSCLSGTGKCPMLKMESYGAFQILDRRWRDDRRCGCARHSER